MNERDLLREALEKALGFKVNVDEVEENLMIEFSASPSIEMNKEMLKEIASKLREINDKSEFLMTEMGIDLLGFESKFLEVIGNLLMVVFNPAQLEVFEYYVYSTSVNKKWSGKVSILIDDEEKSYDISTLDNLWEVLEQLK